MSEEIQSEIKVENDVKDEEIKALREIVQRQNQMLEDRFHLLKTLEGERNALLEVVRMFSQAPKAPPQAQ